MHQLVIHYYKPHQSAVQVEEDSSETLQTYITTMVQSKLKKGKKNLPVMPRIHALGILHLTRVCVKDKNYLILPLAMYLALHLTKDNPSQVTLRIQDISSDLTMSEKSVVKNLKLLENLGYIKPISQSIYYISPKLAFYGKSVAWSVALQCEEEKLELEETKATIARVNKEIETVTKKYIRNSSHESL